jgi:hypothetical protein
MAMTTGVRGAAGWVMLGAVGGVSVGLAVILVAGVSVAEEDGRPLDVDIVAVDATPVPISGVQETGRPGGGDDVTVGGTPSPVGTAPPSTDAGGTVVVPAPGPSEVAIDDDEDQDEADSDEGSGRGSGSNGGGSDPVDD